MAFLFSTERETKMTPRPVYLLLQISVMSLALYVRMCMCVLLHFLKVSFFCAVSVCVFLATVCQVLRHNAGSVSDRQVKWVCVCVCVYTVLSLFTSV